MSCPMEYQTANQWFTDLWNYSIIPYLIEVFRDGAVSSAPGQAQVSIQYSYIGPDVFKIFVTLKFALKKADVKANRMHFR